MVVVDGDYAGGIVLDNTREGRGGHYITRPTDPKILKPVGLDRKYMTRESNCWEVSSVPRAARACAASFWPCGGKRGGGLHKKASGHPISTGNHVNWCIWSRGAKQQAVHDGWHSDPPQARVVRAQWKGCRGKNSLELGSRNTPDPHDWSGRSPQSGAQTAS